MFKTKIKLSYLLISSLLFASCQNENTSSAEQELSLEAQKTFEYLTEVRGISPNDLSIDHEKQSFVFGNDAYITFNLKGNLDKNGFVNDGEFSAKGKKNQWFYGAGVKYYQTQRIAYYVSSGFPREYVEAIKRAAYHWSRVSPNIDIRRTYRRSDGDIYLSSYTNRNTGAWATAQLPQGNGQSGSWLSINRANALGVNVSETTKMTLMIHELGHNLGFYHSDSTNGRLIAGTRGANYHRNNNCGSIMKSSVYNCNWRASSGTSYWTSDDWRAIHWAYTLYR